MRKFILFSLLFLAPILIGLLVLELGLRAIPNEYSYKNDYIEKNGKDIEVLILGSSHAFYGINPEYITKSFSFAFPSQTLDIDEEILKKNENHLSNLKVIVVPISYFSLFGNIANGAESWRLKDYNLYAGIKTPNELQYRFEIFNGKLKDAMSRFSSYYVKNHNRLRTINRLGWGVANRKSNMNDLNESAISAIKRHNCDFTDIETQESINKNLNTLNYFNSYSKLRNVKIVYLTTPVYESYLKRLNQTQYKKMQDLMAGVVNENKNSVYLNMIDDSRFTKDDYFDADHLAEKGSVKLSKILNEKISQLF